MTSDATRPFSRSSRSKLSRHSIERFVGDTLFSRVARAVCEAECLPRKELFESWECARRIRRRMRGGPILEVAGGHGLLSALLLLLDDSSPGATVVDIRKPKSHAKLMLSLASHWPRLAGRIEYLETRLDQVPVLEHCLLVSIHACGELTDEVLNLALASQSRVAVMPCCHDLKRCDSGELLGWVPGPLAVDILRADRMRHAGCQIQTALIPEDITPHNRLLLAWPARS